MLNLVNPIRTAALPEWMVQLQADFTGDGRRPAGNDELEPMVELMQRTGGVVSAAAVPLQAGLAIAVGVTAPDAGAALERARALAVSCARYAGFGTVVVSRERVTQPGSRRA